MKQLIRACRGLVMSIAILALGQESFAQSESEEECFKRNQLTLSIGHSLIPSAKELSSKRKNLLVPTSGLSPEFSFSERFIVGSKSEIEASNYIITDENDSELPGGWALAPEFSYEFKGGHKSACSICLGVGKKF